MPKGRSQDACGFQGNRPSAAPLSLLGGEMGVARSPEGHLMPPPPIFPPGEATGRQVERGPPKSAPPPPPRGWLVLLCGQPGGAGPPECSRYGLGRRPFADTLTARAGT